MKITQEVLSTLVSGDYGVPMDQVLEAMEDNWDRYYGTQAQFHVHHNELDHGGPAEYVVYLAQRMIAHGWQEPTAAWQKVVISYNNTVIDGHHRVLAAFLAGVEIPDHYFSAQPHPSLA